MANATAAVLKIRTAPAAGGSGLINHVNIALIAVSFGVALYLPFQLFLFAYAILGPGHYLTEISWLQKRRFFVKGGYDPYVLAGLALLPAALAMFAPAPLKQMGSAHNMATVIAVAFGIGLVFFLTDKLSARIVGVAVIAALSLIAVNTSAFLVMILALFVPTLIHVYIFTGFFMIFGALKERSTSGYIAFACFLVFPLLYFFIKPVSLAPTDYVVQTYWHPFSALNAALLGLANPRSQMEMDENVRRVFGSSAGLIAMRFIAFAYTYHYLNWFSKTGIIKWHQVTRQRLSAIVVIWAACVGFYLYDAGSAMKVLFCLSFLHVFLEFPLNHMSIMGVARHFPLFTRNRVQAEPARAKAIAR